MSQPITISINLNLSGASKQTVDDVVTSLNNLGTTEKGTQDTTNKLGSAVDNASQSYKGFFKEQRLQDRIMNEGKTTLQGVASAFVLLDQAMGNNSSTGQAVIASLTSVVMTAQATEFGLFSLGKMGAGLGGTLGMLAMKVGGLAGPISMVIGIGAGLISFFMKSNEEAEKAANEGLSKFNEQISGMGVSDLEKLSAGIKKRFDLIREERLKLQNSNPDLPPDGTVSKETIEKATLAFERLRATRLSQLQEEEDGLNKISETTEAQLTKERQMAGYRALGESVLSDTFNTIQSIHAELDKIALLEKAGKSVDENGVSLADKKLKLQTKLGELTKGELEKAIIAGDRALEIEKAKTDAMKEGTAKRQKQIEDESAAEALALKRRIGNGKQDQLTKDQYDILEQQRKTKKEARLQEMWEFEKTKLAQAKTEFEKYAQSMADLNDQLALAMTATDEEERLLHKQQLQKKIEDYKAMCALTIDEELALKKALIELKRLETSDERKLANELSVLRKRLRDLTIEGIEDEHKRALAAIRERYDEEVRLAEGNAEKIELIEQARNKEVEQENKKYVESFNDVETLLDRKLTQVENKLVAKMQPIADAIGSSFQSAWGSILDASRTGAEKIKDIWEGIKQSIWNAIGQILAKWIVAQAIMFGLSLFNPIGAATKGIDSGIPAGGGGFGFPGYDGSMLGKTTIVLPNFPIGRDALNASQNASPSSNNNSDLLYAINKLTRKVEQMNNTVIVSEVEGETFVRKNLTEAERNRTRRTKF